MNLYKFKFLFAGVMYLFVVNFRVNAQYLGGNGRGDAKANASSVYPGNYWLGTGTTDFSLGSNWSSGSFPSGESAQIPAGGTQPEQITSLINLNSGTILSVESGAYLILNTSTTFQINSGAKFIVKPNGILQIDGNLINSGTIVFQSNSTGEGRLTTSTGSISGNITVERYIPARRAFRFLSSPVTTSNGISNNWQLQTHISGSGTGFDNNGTNSPSMFTLNENTQLWEPITNTNTQNLTQSFGYRILIRGDRTIDITNSAATPTSTILSATGTHAIGDKTFNTSSTPAFPTVSGSYVLVGNPFPSAINWSLTTKSGISSTYYTWRSQGGTNNRGAFVNYNNIGNISSDGNVNKYIASGSSFMIVTTNSNPSLVITESCKVSNAQGTQILGKKSNQASIRIQLIEDDSLFADGLFIYQNDSAKDNYEEFDSEKWINPGVSIYSLTSDNKKTSIQGLEEFKDNSTIELGFEKSEKKLYQLAFTELENLPTEVRLFDRFLNQSTLLNNNSSYYFSVNSDVASSAINRFYLGFGKAASGIGSNINQKPSIGLFPNPANKSLHIYMNGQEPQASDYSIYDQLGKEIQSGSVQIDSSRSAEVSIQELNPGIYFIKVSGNNFTQTIKFIK